MTFSIIARDPATGAFGVATATGNLAVGAQVPHAEFGLGAVATQGYTTNPKYGRDGLDLLARGSSASQVVDALTARDDGRAQRQIVVMDAQGRSAGWTGAENRGVKAHLCAVGLAVAGNYLPDAAVLDAMRAAYLDAETAAFGVRLLAALADGQRAGGDVRGTCSSAVLIASGGAVPLDLRVDYAADPIAAICDLYQHSQHPDYQAFLARLPDGEDPNHP